MPNPEQRLLIVDDDESFRTSVTNFFETASREVIGVGTGQEGIAVCRRLRVDVVLLDQHLPDGLGLDFCRALLQHQEQLKIVFITAFANLEDAVQAVRTGAFDYLSKPVELAELELVVARALETVALGRLAALQRRRQAREGALASVIASQRGLDTVRALVEKASQSEANVLITGETGTGKSFLARAIHHLGPRRREPFVSVNCAALPPHLVESEILGHERGAFTGAQRARRGVFEMADGGTLLLDEIGAMDPALQTRLLGVLEERVVRRVGGEHSRPVDVRVIAATNARLDEDAAPQVLRYDLYYRLNVLRIPLPPLRERSGDIPGLVGQFLDELAGPGAPVLSPEELRRLRAYHWPGNIRELRNILERAVAIQPRSALRPSALLDLPTPTPAPAPASHALSGGAPLDAAQSARILPLKDVEQHHILSAYARLRQNLAHTARALGISESTLRRKLRGYLAESDSPTASGQPA